MANTSNKPNYRLKHVLSGHEKGAVSVKFSSSGALLASASADDTIKIWDPHSGKLIRTLKGHARVRHHQSMPAPESLHFAVPPRSSSPSSRSKSTQLKWLACGQGCSDVAWDSRDLYLCSASDDKTLKLWDVATGECVRTLEGHTNYVLCCNFNPQGNRVVR